MKNIRLIINIRRVVGVILLLLFIFYCFSLPSNLFDVSYSTVVTDRDGNLLGARIADDGQWRFPSSELLPDKFKKSIITFEDKYYMWHWGVNPVSLSRAFYSNIKHRRVVSGGSTITMQTIRLSRKKRRTVLEKFKEIMLATRLEFKYSKESILILYATHAPFGGNVVGLEAASWRYFGHSADDLSWAEAATLAVLPNAPSMIHMQKNREKLLIKRNSLLLAMHKKGYISELDYELSLSEVLPSIVHPLPVLASHLVDYFYLTAKGKKSVTTIDRQKQIQVEDILLRWSDRFRAEGISNLAAIVMDVSTKQVVSYCGNVPSSSHSSNKKEGEQVDMIRSPRSVGSLWKPLLYYLALEEGEILPYTLLPDIPLKFGAFKPQNFNLRYDGAVPADMVITRSLNIPCVHLLHRLGLNKFYNFLQKTGISTLNEPPGHYGLSLILGGAEGTLLDVTSVYTDMARSLRHLPRKQFQLLSDTLSQENMLSYPFDPAIVWQTFESMKNVNRPDEIDWESMPSMRTVAWKTGTSFGFRDGWAVGVTRNHVIGVWVGNASGEGRPGLTGAQTAAHVLFEVIGASPYQKWFDPVYDNLVDAEVCSKSGYLKGRFCEGSINMAISPMGVNSGVCPFHRSINVTSDGKYRLYESCAKEREVVQRNWFVLPPAWEWYYKQHNSDYTPLPPLLNGCNSDDILPMQFIYPSSAFSSIKIPRQLNGRVGEVTFELAHSRSNATVFWHIDNDYINETSVFHRLSVALDAGQHSITVVDDGGNTISITVVVE